MSPRSSRLRRWKVDHVVATFSPPESDLAPPLQSAVGRRGRFRIVLRDATGEQAMTPLETWAVFPFVSCPSSHLTDVERVVGSVLERRRAGRFRSDARG